MSSSPESTRRTAPPSPGSAFRSRIDITGTHDKRLAAAGPLHVLQARDRALEALGLPIDAASLAATRPRADQRVEIGQHADELGLVAIGVDQHGPARPAVAQV